MSHNAIFTLLIVTPLLFSLLAFACRPLGAAARSAVTLLHGIGILALLGVTFYAVGAVYQQGDIFSSNLWLHVDSLSALFLGILGLIGFLTGMYSMGYMRHEVDEGEISVATLCNYYGFFHLFLFTMMLVVTSNNLIVMWAAIEATTLSSAFLVGIYGQRSSLEAAWKYIIICTVGVAFGLFGTILVYANAASFMPDPGNAIFWTEVLKHAGELDPTLMHLAFVFVLIGFGTKTGLFPMHAWLPDAHSEAPSPTSALLSAVLLNCALLVIIRFYIIISQAIGPQFPSTLLLIFGLLSVAVAAFFILVQHDIKRLLAYSSVENMGLIAVALGIGGPLGVLAALLHTLNHSLAKTLLFCGSGNVLLKYGTRDLGVVRGMLKLMPFSAVLLAGGALALGGMPPFNIFLSEFMTVTAGLAAGHLWLTIVLLLLLTVVLGGLVRMVACLLFGAAPQATSRGELGLLTTLPMAILLVLMLLMGTHIPQPVSRMLENAASVVMKATPQQTFQWPWAASRATSSNHSDCTRECTGEMK
ncbi:MAG: hydrogenase 4 subunit F [Yokenella regensburgei]|jgi:hydrogenase-4 component F|uniref:Hydrogenase-4 component B n=1 Tax=Yokenella regensburgei TaxID=158877 RepID=A0AB38FTS4_9ENTR|nr:hydrogenase 4 subunit F [Yokenella regensburgei]EHM49062.1 hydrogenase 4 subunit F [Yokenella regensburgei ATCC 43003]KFD23423.1 hydrogenase-4 component F [Yokenella regensburgei ATCC 49455]MDQ4430347.1 hydrogenase 4 subunit F [Yokenella regensburgei]MDR3103857.1 hydrogenase 4 subunit F [Yokenella regensburgei]QIU90204.1 hydrogenase 4 subunit F [Yokenella regensburgei]